jgi:hypothetical protein
MKNDSAIAQMVREAVRVWNGSESDLLLALQDKRFCHCFGRDAVAAANGVTRLFHPFHLSTFGGIALDFDDKIDKAKLIRSHPLFNRGRRPRVQWFDQAAEISCHFNLVRFTNPRHLVLADQVVFLKTLGFAPAGLAGLVGFATFCHSVSDYMWNIGKVLALASVADDGMNCNVPVLSRPNRNMPTSITVKAVTGDTDPAGGILLVEDSWL